jgi:hypothetical protein
MKMSQRNKDKSKINGYLRRRIRGIIKVPDLMWGKIHTKTIM